MSRAAMWVLLAVVAGAAAVLSFSALRDLAALCGFAPTLAWLLPVVVDAGAAAGCVCWLSRSSPSEERDARQGSGDPFGPPAHGSGEQNCSPGRHFARSLTFVLLASSVTGNAVVHYLTAYSLRPAWWLVVAVSAVAPAVLGAVVHLAVLTAQSRTEPAVSAADGLDDEPGCEDTPDFWADAPFADTPGGRAAELLAAGAGRRKLARELGISEHQARQIIAERAS